MRTLLFKKTKSSVIPGFGLTMGFTFLYMAVLVIVPLSMVFFHTMSMGPGDVWHIISEPRAAASYRLSFLTAGCAALINAVFGVVIAWVLTRYDFPGKRLADGLVDLPFALPTAVAGITLTAMYSPDGWIGQLFPFRISFTPIGIVIALTFIGLPFVVRMVQPVLENLQKETEEASVSLGASKWKTFQKVILPELFPSIISGFALSFARALGEYGSVVFIAGNMPFKTEISPLIIMTKLEQYDYAGATAVAAVMLVITFFILFVINGWQWLTARKYAGR
ncbi:sulfate ABC transporter permease subunit CysT [Bacillus velezensis]|uniref:sulfate ABC transporter permease subunit CysT n=1 Tax=Bacillus velezensis TaxID=492670 RepID=UPI00246935BC|nr:sulfate ABC transporter permease subunit CysT [Bacillus velezensis]MDH5842336.1 sulfate ABC transporter permease subunit CysT [Bacillus velezensis]